MKIGRIYYKGKCKNSISFIEDNIDKDGVLKILEDAGVGLPSYYDWRSRSG